MRSADSKSFIPLSRILYLCVVCYIHTTMFVCILCIPPVGASMVRMAQLAWRSQQTGHTREPAISQTQPAHYRRAHDNSCLVPAQGQGCNCCYVMKRRRGGEQRKDFFFYWDVSQCVIVHRANRLPVTRSGWGLLLTDFSVVTGRGVLVTQHVRNSMYKCGVLGLSSTKHMCCMSSPLSLFLFTCDSYCSLLLKT